MEDYYINLYTKEFTKSFSRAQNGTAVVFASK